MLSTTKLNSIHSCYFFSRTIYTFLNIIIQENKKNSNRFLNHWNIKELKEWERRWMYRKEREKNIMLFAFFFLLKWSPSVRTRKKPLFILFFIRRLSNKYIDLGVRKKPVYSSISFSLSHSLDLTQSWK